MSWFKPWKSISVRPSEDVFYFVLFLHFASSKKKTRPCVQGVSSGWNQE